MQVFGKAEELKEFMKKKYDAEIDQLNKENNKQVSYVEADIERELSAMRNKMDAQSHREAEQAKSKTFSEEKLLAKKEFEKTREELIDNVFADIEKALPSLAHSPRYLAYLKKKTKGMDKKKFTVKADGDYYKKLFPKYTKDTSTVGVKMVSGEVTYDFSLTTALEVNKELLRHEVSEVLFG